MCSQTVPERWDPQGLRANHTMNSQEPPREMMRVLNQSHQVVQGLNLALEKFQGSSSFKYQLSMWRLKELQITYCSDLKSDFFSWSSGSDSTGRFIIFVMNTHFEMHILWTSSKMCVLKAKWNPSLKFWCFVFPNLAWITRFYFPYPNLWQCLSPMKWLKITNVSGSLSKHT